MGSSYNFLMRIISRKTLKDFWDHHPDARQPLQAWFSDTRQAVWKTPMDIKEAYRNISFITSNRVVFNIKGNRYRLVVSIQYQYGIVYIRFVGTHKE